MSLFIDRIDSAPIINEEFDPQFLQWIWVLVDSLNQTFTDLENAFNVLTAMSYSAADIASLNAAGTLVNGVILYDMTNNVYVGKQNGLLVQFTTTPYP